MKSIKTFLIGIFFGGGLIVGLHLLHAQETAMPVQVGAISAVDWNSASDLRVMLQAVKMMPMVSADSMPHFGTFYSAQHSPGSPQPWPPLPGNPNGLPVWNLGDGIYLLNDEQVDYSMPLMSSRMAGGGMMAANGPMPPGAGNGGNGTNGFYSVSFNYTLPTNGLWLEMDGITNQEVYITAHNVMADYFQLLSKTNLLESDWKLEQLFQADTNSELALDPVPELNPGATNSQMFFWAKQSDALIGVNDNGDAIRPSPGFDAVPGGFRFNLEDADNAYDSDIVIYFSLSGTASNGVDYVVRNPSTGEILGNSIMIQAGDTGANIEIDPATNLLCISNLTVTLTLEDGPDYLVDYDNYDHLGWSAANNTIIANVFSLVTNLTAPCGIDYHPPTQSLIISSRNSSGVFSFLRMDATGAITPWSSLNISGQDEVKLATVKTTANGFTNGAMYFGNGQGGIGWLSPDGSVANLNWLALTGNPFYGLYLDQSGSFGTNLIAVKRYDSVWKINSAGVSNKLVNLPNYYLEGVVTLTNDSNQYGPWAGKIITGNQSDSENAEIYAISTNSFNRYPLGIYVEDCDIILTNQNLYICDDQDQGGWLLKVSQGVFTNHVGDVLFTEAFPPKLVIVHWNATNSIFVKTEIIPPHASGFEHSTFAPIDIPPVSQ